MAGEIIYGVNAVREALRTGQAVNRVYFAKESRSKGTSELVAAAKEHKVRFDFVPQAKLNSLTKTHEHQGVAAAMSPVAYATLDHVLKSCPKTARLLVLDQVQHPKNLGILIRTAAGAGASAVLLCAKSSALVDDSVIRASAGTALHVPLVICPNLGQALRKVRDAGFWLYALDADGDSDVFHTNWPDRCAIIMGNETKGIRPVIRKQCDARVSIPLEGGLDSLNVAVAGGIALFQVMSTHRDAEKA